MGRRFLRQDLNNTKGLKAKWRKPTGRHSKLRLNKAGHWKKPSPGFKRALVDRYKHPSGLYAEVVSNISQLSNLKGKGALISSTLGLKKKLAILEKAKELKITVLNVKNVEEFIKSSSELLHKRKEEKKKKQTHKKKSREESLKKADKKSEEKKDENKEAKNVKLAPESKETAQAVSQKDIKPSKQVHHISAPQQK